MSEFVRYCGMCRERRVGLNTIGSWKMMRAIHYQAQCLNCGTCGPISMIQVVAMQEWNKQQELIVSGRNKENKE